MVARFSAGCGHTSEFFGSMGNVVFGSIVERCGGLVAVTDSETCVRVVWVIHGRFLFHDSDGGSVRIEAIGLVQIGAGFWFRNVFGERIEKRFVDVFAKAIGQERRVRAGCVVLEAVLFDGVQDPLRFA